MSQPPVPSWARQPQLRIGAVVAVALAIGFVIWLFVTHIGGGSKNSSATTTATAVESIGPKAASVDELAALPETVGHPVYWAGPKANTTYELTRTPANRTYIRYLPKNVPIKTKTASFTFVGTYPFDNALAGLKAVAKKNSDVTFSVPGNGFAAYAKDAPTNVYVAYPNSDVQIEVFDPSPERARSLITSGQIAPVP